MRAIPSTLISLGFAALAAASDEDVVSFSAIGEVDIVFPREDTYAAEAPFPVVFGLQNAPVLTTFSGTLNWELDCAYTLFGIGRLYLDFLPDSEPYYFLNTSNAVADADEGDQFQYWRGEEDSCILKRRGNITFTLHPEAKTARKAIAEYDGCAIGDTAVKVERNHTVGCPILARDASPKPKPCNLDVKKARSSLAEAIVKPTTNVAIELESSSSKADNCLFKSYQHNTQSAVRLHKQCENWFHQRISARPMPVQHRPPSGALPNPSNTTIGGLLVKVKSAIRAAEDTSLQGILDADNSALRQQLTALGGSPQPLVGGDRRRHDTQPLADDMGQYQIVFVLLGYLSMLLIPSDTDKELSAPFDEYCRELLITIGIIFGQQRDSRHQAERCAIRDWSETFQNDQLLQDLCTTRWHEHLLFEYLISPPTRANYAVNVDFPFLGERLLKLQEYMNQQSPNDFSTLIFDKRDPLRYWTFVLAVGLAGLSIVLSVVQAGIATASLALDARAGGN
ncbi:hypothetical protein IL306_002300 [Fusarium sp. DS 682]|nr:hypothetical protein IL306_002300 [Fusarium sp. DS 682]